MWNRGRTPRAFAGAVAAVLVAAGVSACGSGGASGASSFVAKANRLCANGSTARGGVVETIGDSNKLNSSPAAAGLAAGEEQILEEQIRGLRALESSAPSKEQLAELIGKGEAMLAQVRHAEADATRNELSAYTAMREKQAQLSKEARQISAELELEDCAGKGLKPSDIEAIRHVATVTATVDDTSQCKQLMTPAFVDELYGNLAGCIQIQREEQPNPSSVTLTDIEGAGDFATADATLHGGEFDGQRYGLTFYRQGGNWRLQSNYAK
jgi:hypothetical protein